MKSSIVGRTMLIYGGILLVIISLTFWISYKGTVGGLKQQLKETHMALLKQIDQKIEMVFQQTENNLLQLTNELEFVYFMNDSYKDNVEKNTNFYALNSKLTRFMDNNRQFSSVFVYSSVSGSILTEKVYTHIENSENKWITEYLDMPGYFQWLTTHKIWDGNVNRDVVTLIRSYPAISAPGYRKGLLAANIDENVLYQMIDGIYEDNFQGHTFVLDQNGEIVTHDDKTKLYSNMKELPYIQKVLSGEDNGSFTAEIEQVRQTVSYKTSDYTGWKIVSIVPESQVLKPLYVTRNLLIVFAVAMFAVAFIIIFFINRRTFTPVDRLIGKLSGAYKPVAKSAKEARPSPLGVSYLENIFDQMFIDRELMEKQLRDSKPMLKWRTVMDILTGYRQEYALVKPQLEFIGLSLFAERYVVCTAEIGKEGGIAPKDEMLYTYALCNVAEEMINVENAGVAIDLGSGRAVILFSFPEGDGEQNHLRAAALLEQILDVMHRQIGVTVAAGLGKGYREMKDIPLSYAESLQALPYKMVTGRHSVISIWDVQSPDNQDYYRIVQMIDRVVEALKQTDITAMQNRLQAIYAEAVKGNLSPDLIRQFSFELVMRSAQTMEAIGIQMEETLAEIGNLHERISRSENWRETEQLVDSILMTMADKLEHRRGLRRKNETVKKMLQYIDENYRDSGLSLDRLADEFHLNPTYISKLFKEQVEDNFIDYLIKIRIEAAKKLLCDKSIRINDISDAIGYAYSRSFTRTFKKYTGLTPTEYRDTVAGQE